MNAQSKANAKWRAKNRKQIVLTVTKELYEQIKEEAEKQGTSITQYLINGHEKQRSS